MTITHDINRAVRSYAKWVLVGSLFVLASCGDGATTTKTAGQAGPPASPTADGPESLEDSTDYKQFAPTS